MREVPNGQVWLTEANPAPAASVPCPSQVWIEHEGTILECHGIIQSADHVGKGMSAARQRDGIIRA